MPLDESVEELRKESDVHGEQAVLCFLEGRFDQALGYADRAVQAHDELCRALGGGPSLLLATHVYATRLIHRAEIRRALCRTLPDPRLRERECRPALEDCRLAVEAFRRGAAAARGELPLWIPAAQLLAAEFHAWAGEPYTALDQSVQAIAHYRTRGIAGPEGGAVLAHALARCADLLWVAGARQESLDARCEAVETYRAHTAVGGLLWDRRHNQGVTWSTTPTYEDFCRTAQLLAGCAGEPRAGAAPAVLPALQDAVEGWAELVPLHDYPHHQPSTAMSELTASALTMQRWLGALGEQELAQRYYQAFRSCVPRTPHDQRWAVPVRELRADVEAAAARFG